MSDGGEGGGARGRGVPGDAGAPGPAAPGGAGPAGAPVATLVPLGLVALPMGLGLLAELVGWLVVAAAAPLHAGWYGWPSLLVGVHLVVLGGLLLPLVGAGWQLTPVVTAAPLPPATVRVAAHAGRAAVLGALLLWAGMAASPWVGALGVALLLAALLARSAAVVPALVRARGRVGIRAWLLAAEASLWGGLAYAAVLYAGKLGYPVLPDPIGGIGPHVALLAVGWIGGWEIGLGALLLPMFALGREPRPAPLALAGALWFGGLAVGVIAGAPAVWAVGAALAVALLLRSLFGAARVRSAGPGLLQAGIALLGLLAVAVAAVFGALPAHALVAAAFALWLVPLQHGVAARVVPFLLWAHVLAGRSSTPPASLVDARVVWAQLSATAAGGLLLVGGLAWDAEGVARAGAALLAVGAALHLAAVAGAGLRVFRTWRSAMALPGTARAQSEEG